MMATTKSHTAWLKLSKSKLKTVNDIAVKFFELEQGSSRTVPRSEISLDVTIHSISESKVKYRRVRKRTCVSGAQAYPTKLLPCRIKIRIVLTSPAKTT